MAAVYAGHLYIIGVIEVTAIDHHIVIDLSIPCYVHLTTTKAIIEVPTTIAFTLFVPPDPRPVNRSLESLH